MNIAIRQVLTVPADGTLQIRDPALAPGSSAEVIVLVESRPTAAQSFSLATWQALQDSLALSSTQAAAWRRELRAEREAFGAGQ